MTTTDIRRGLAALLLGVACAARGQFVETGLGTNLAPDRPAVVWGDYNNDGAPDVFVAGPLKKGVITAQLLRNVNGVFTNTGFAFTGVEYANGAWGDYDNDGDVDLITMGLTATGLRLTRLYQNNGTNFTPVTGAPVSAFVNACAGMLAWLDYDNDGDLDLLVAGLLSNPIVNPATVGTRLYRNDRTNFVTVASGLPDAYLGTMACADADGDGDVDVYLGGNNVLGTGGLYLNHSGTFLLMTNSPPGLSLGQAAWGDYDNDGDPDLLLCGQIDDGSSAAVYRNDGGAFTPLGVVLPNLIWAAAGWGDYDSDGDLDAAIMGYDVNETNQSVQVHADLVRNNGTSFTWLPQVFPHAGMMGTLAWMDYNSDGRLDTCLSGYESDGGGSFLMLFRNTISATNTIPGAPQGLTVAPDGRAVTLSWGSGSDAQTPASGLNYSLRLGTTPGGGEVVSPQAQSTGVRQVPERGNVIRGRSARITGLTVGTTYYWSVQSVDHAMAGSPFAAEGSFIATNAVPTHVALARGTNGLMVVTFHGSAGGAYRIEASDDLTAWTPVAAPTADAGGAFGYADPDSAMKTHRFYRAARP
jgi:hypothetical protein